MAETKTKKGPGRPKGSKNKKSSETNIPNTPKSKEEQFKEYQKKTKQESRINDVIWAIAIFAVGAFFFFTIVTDTTGEMGKYIHDVCIGLFGFFAYVLPFYFIVYSILLFMRKMQHIGTRTLICSIILFIDLCILNSYRFINEKALKFAFTDIADYYKDGVAGNGGGAIGMELGNLIVKLVGKPGLIIFGLALLVICLLLLVNSPLSKAIERFREKRETKRFLTQLEYDQIDGKKDDMIFKTASLTLPPASKSNEHEKADKIKDNNAQNVSKAAEIDKINNIDKPAVLPSVDFDRDDSSSKPTDASKSYGLDGAVPMRTGYGLGDYGIKSVSHMGSELGANSTQNTVGKGLAGNNNTKAGAGSEVEILGASDSDKSDKLIVEPMIDTQAVDEEKADSKATSPAKKIKSSKAKSVEIDDDMELEKNLESSMSSNEDIGYKLPDISLLKMPKTSNASMSSSELQNKAMLLEKTLNDFGVSATVLKVTQGASVTRYEVQPATGVKVNKITALADDIALNMRAKSIRMEAPIPGKAAVGIEIENDKAAPVLVRELIESEEFKKSKSKISFVVGKDISGNNVVADLKEMPHLLIAGATGSGKSVCINTIIASILYKASPYEVKLIMIDPKVVELGNYNGIPHMSIPVVTDPKKAARALNWAVGEMNKRYEDFAKVRVRDLESYNEYARLNHMEVKPEIVIIIDELADLMMAAPSQVEESICRLAQKARAAGMHLIVATQRPSVDVVTGVIKANIPSRIAFSVSSQFDSRTILDMAGAEKLLGKGDMLFSPVGANKPTRVQGPYISDMEIARIIDFAKNQANPDYNEELENDLSQDGEHANGKNTPDTDELTEDAIEFILKSKQASVSMLQRRFRIGYNRAARIIDEIEAMGIIGPSDGSRPRQVLVTEEDYYGTEEQIAVSYDEDEEADNQESVE